METYFPCISVQQFSNTKSRRPIIKISKSINYSGYKLTIHVERNDKDAPDSAPFQALPSPLIACRASVTRGESENRISAVAQWIHFTFHPGQFLFNVPQIFDHTFLQSFRQNSVQYILCRPKEMWARLVPPLAPGSTSPTYLLASKVHKMCLKSPCTVVWFSHLFYCLCDYHPEGRLMQCHR